MPEQNEVILVKWMVVTDKGEYTISENEMEILMEADKRGARFVMFDKVVLNIAFIKEAYKVTERKDLRFNSMVGEEKFISERKELNAGK
jgi:hypothetical protein